MKFEFAKDTWLSKEYTFARTGILSYDKVQHFLGGFFFALLNIWFSIVFWLLWEIKDGFISWKDGYITSFPIRYNWGGDGFSWRDLVASWAGVLIWVLIRSLFT
jgi:hypothetical protein